VYIANCMKMYNIKCFTIFVECVYGLSSNWILHGGSLIITSKCETGYSLCTDTTL
jgi:hypothetical protein